ncbi:hypothetical protein BDQ17DRAFT_1419249 [Cyathus striatus]|nr:hypothetical protein BDQ17DRAFT_1419249 [Cyathus striatus]
MPSPSTLPLIPQILSLICEQLTSEKATLASLASTCKSFEGPALDVLWSKLNGFHPLLKCIPSHLWKEERDESNKRYVVLRQPLAPADCSRLLFYAGKVQDFTAEFQGDERQVHVNVYQSLQFMLQGKKLLRNVRHLTWSCRSTSFPFIHMFTGPRLNKIILYELLPKSAMQLSLVSALSEHHPKLTDFCLTFASGVPLNTRKRAVELISNSVYKWKNLQSLEIPNITYSALLNMSQLPHLKKLDILDYYKVDHAPSLSGISTGGFPALKFFRLQKCYHISDCTSVLKLMDGSPLVNIVLYFTGVMTSELWKQLFLHISEHCDHNSLMELYCRDGLDRDDKIIMAKSDDMVDYEAVKPLLVFCNAAWIDINTTTGFCFSDPIMIKEMAKSWRNIQELCFRQLPFSRASEPSQIALLDLVPFAQHCPELELLGLSFDAASTPEVDREDFPWGEIYQTKLREIHVGDSPIKDPELVAATLSGIFPSLKSLHTIEFQEAQISNTPEITGAKNMRWKQAEGLVKVFSDVREQERSYAKRCKAEIKVELKQEDDNT